MEISEDSFEEENYWNLQVLLFLINDWWFMIYDILIFFFVLRIMQLKVKIWKQKYYKIGKIQNYVYKT